MGFRVEGLSLGLWDQNRVMFQLHYLSTTEGSARCAREPDMLSLQTVRDRLTPKVQYMDLKYLSSPSGGGCGIPYTTLYPSSNPYRNLADKKLYHGVTFRRRCLRSSQGMPEQQWPLRKR